MFLLTLSAAGILLVFGLYPLCLLGLGLVRRGRTRAQDARPPSASLLVAVRNAEALVADKLRNSLALEVPSALEIVFVSDGSTDRTVERLRALAPEGVQVLEVAEHGRCRPHGEPPGQLEVTVVFVDLSGFTALTEAMGDLKTAEVLDRFSGLVRQSVTAFGGQVVKQIGDAFLLVFREPGSAASSRRRNATRACRPAEERSHRERVDSLSIRCPNR